jgi:hypothetical protein
MNRSSGGNRQMTKFIAILLILYLLAGCRAPSKKSGPIRKCRTTSECDPGEFCVDEPGQTEFGTCRKKIPD